VSPNRSSAYYPGNTSDVARWSFYLLVFLAGFMPLEDFILKFLPGPDIVFFASRFISELLIYGTALWITWHKISLKAPFGRTPIDSLILLFASICVISLVVNMGEDFVPSLVVGILNIRPLFRYVVLFFLVVNTPLSARQVNVVIWALIFSGTFQVFLGLAEWASGGALDAFLAPRGTDIQVAGEMRHSRILEGSREMGAIHGTASDTVFYALSMNVLFLTCMAKLRCSLFSVSDRHRTGTPKNLTRFRQAFSKSEIFLMMFIPLVIIADLLTYVRASLMTIAVIIVLESFYWFGRKISLFFASQALALLLLIVVVFPPTWVGGGRNVEVNPLADLTSIFTEEYLLNNIENQRLHQLLRITPTVILNRPVLGYGPTETEVVAAINTAEPSFLLRKINQPEFQDVYWVAILAKYGLAGLLTLIAIFYSLFRAAQLVLAETGNPVLKEVALMVLYMIIIASLTLFFNRALELRVFGFYFWLLPGLMFSMTNQYRSLKATKAT